MKNKAFENIKRELRSARSALIAVHIDPDGDAIGSAIALAMLLEKLGIAATIYSQDGVPKIYRFLAWSDRIINTPPLKKQFDLFFCVDSSGFERIGNKANLRNVSSTIINIDHHPDNTMYGSINYVEKVSSVAEQIYQLFAYLKIEVDKKVAENLYVAMITDTGNFRYENTSVSTFLMASELLKRGINPHEITTHIYDTKSLSSIKISALAMSKLGFSKDKKVAWTAVSEAMMTEVGARGEDLVGLVDSIRSIERVEVAILFRQDKGRIKVNFRSKYGANVSEIAKRFGGGGHLKAAGAIVKGSLDSCVENVVSETIKYLEASKYLV